jgi:hypothetical protein
VRQPRHHGSSGRRGGERPRSPHHGTATGAVPDGPPGSTTRGVWGKSTARHVGDPRRSWPAGQVGHPNRQTGRRRRGGGQRSPQDAATVGPCPWGRGGQADGAGTGHIARTRRAGEPRSTCWPGLAKQAPAQPNHRVGHRDEWRPAPCLKAGGRDIRTEAASGVDRRRAPDDERHRAEHRHHLVARRQRKRDRATRVSRRDIPTGEGQRRRFGMPAVEAKRRPRAVTRRRPAIAEEDCRRWRAGDRPPVGARDAVERLPMTRPGGRDNVVVEADSQGCCDHIEQAWVRRRWGARLEDGAFRRRIRTWRRAGVLETDGPVLPPVPGTPHGGIRSPLLAHGDRHAALDRWFHPGGQPRGGGAAGLRRDADDGVGACPDQAAAERFSRALGPRLGTFGRERSPDTTRVLPCTRPQGPGPTRCDVLGLALRWGRDRARKPPRQRRTSRQQRRNARKRGTDWGQAKGRSRLQDRCSALHAQVRGSDHDDGVHGHAASRHAVCTGVRRSRCNGLHRRSPRRS